MKTRAVLASFLMSVALMGTMPRLGAQHGEAPDGYYPPGFMGDTWTGQISAVDPEKREITLTATTKKGTETFVGYVPEHFAVQRDGKPYEVQMSDFGAGQKLRVYYVPKNPKVNGQKIKRNEIIKIEAVPATKGS